MAKLALLRHEEGVRLDPDRLVALYSELGERGAEEVMARAMGDLAARLNEMQRLADEGDDAALMRSARILAKGAAQIGMSSFARVANDVIATTRRGDWIAQAATLARLVQIAERSLCAVWDLRRMTR